VNNVGGIWFIDSFGVSLATRNTACNSGTTAQVRMMRSLLLCHRTGVCRPVQVLCRRHVCLNCPVPSCALETLDEVRLLRECWCFGLHFWVCALLHFAHTNIDHATA